MSIELSFKGRIKSRQRLMEKMTEIAKHYPYEINTSHEDDIIVTLCPTGEIYFHVTEGGLLQKTKVEGYFQSSPAGPGFHKAAVDFIDALEINNLAYEDDSEYAINRDFQRLCRNHFYRWLERLVELAMQDVQERTEPIFICWSTEQYYPIIKGAKIVAPTGLWDINTLSQFVQDNGIEAFADRFFIWPHEQQDATFYRNCALKVLWEDCYYAPSDRSETDKEINKYVIKQLEAAYSLAPLLPIPYDSYCEICRLNGQMPVIPETAIRMNNKNQPGHRRGMVRETIDRITITIPGSYQRHLEFSDNDWPITIWSDSSSNSPVWRLTIFKLDEEQEKPTLNDDNYCYLEEFDIETGKAVLTVERCQENDEEFYVAVCQIASGTSLYLITVSYTEQAEFDNIRDLLLLITCQN